MADVSEVEKNEVIEKARSAEGFVDFVHLHNHTHYSLLDGLQKVPQLVDKVEALGQTAVAITDHGSLSGAIEFYKACVERGIKPIIGLETYVAPRKHTDKSSAEDRNPYHLTLLAQNQQGYQNLMRLSTIANLEGFYYKPRVDHELLEKYREGLIVLSGCAGGEVGTYILNDEFERALETAKWYQNIFGKDHYYLEMQPHIEQEFQRKVNEGVQKISKVTGIPLVVTGDAHYTDSDHHYAHDILLCVQTGSTVEQPNRMKLEMDLSVNSGASMLEKFPDHPEAISNTVKIASMCQLEIELGKILIPRFEVPKGETEKSYLRKLVFEGAGYRYGGFSKQEVSGLTEAKVKPKLSPEVLDRIEFELRVIGDMGYEGYMLIVADLINWSKNQGIICGPGRGSAAGSIISYATGITELDPLKYDLLFERFLNPDRISMPDIDMDYADDRREEVIAYATEKYGHEQVAQIITFGIMAARNAVRDTGRVLGIPYGEVDAIAKKIPAPVQGRHIQLAKLIVDDPELQAEYQRNPQAKQIIDVAMQLEGTIRNAGTHAAGVVIAPDSLVKFLPLTRASKGGVSTQFIGTTVEDLGLLKFDFLGLSNLTIIKNALRIVRKVYGKEIDPTQIPIDDAATYELFARGDTTGVFQFESAGMKRYLRELKPDRFDDIIAMGALYRPGPMQWIDDFINRKHNPELVQYGHPKMQDALQNTYGVIVYQEQVMQIAKDLCGFTGGQADTLRKGIGKKIPEVLAKMKKEFIEGGIKTIQVDKNFIEDLWKSLEDFAAYSFNKSHAACYALIAVQTAWLKAHYPAAFMAALLTSDHENLDRIAIEVAECKKMDLEVLPPDINESFAEFAVVPKSNKIRFGLGAIKNVGMGPVEKILEARDDGGAFKSIEDFCRRVDATVINKKVMESLFKCGAFDGFGERDMLLANMDRITIYAGRAQKSALSGQIDIFGSMGMEAEIPPLQLDPPSEVSDSRTKLLWEKELLGLYISKHPLDDFRNYLLGKTETIKKYGRNDDNKAVTVGGIVIGMRKIHTKNGDPMAFVQLETLDGEIELIVFPRTFEKYGDLVVEDAVLEIKGKINARDREGNATDELKIMADAVKKIDFDVAKHSPPPKEKPESNLDAPVPADQSVSAVFLRLANSTDAEQLMKVKNVLDGAKGSTPVVLFFTSSGQAMKLPSGVKLTHELQQTLADLVGKDNYKLQRQPANKLA